MTPHLCPKCQGERVVAHQIGEYSSGQTRDCPTCKGEGVLWEPASIPSMWTEPNSVIPPKVTWWGRTPGGGLMDFDPDGNKTMPINVTIRGGPVALVSPNAPDTFTPTTGAT